MRAARAPVGKVPGRRACGAAPTPPSREGELDGTPTKHKKEESAKPCGKPLVITSTTNVEPGRWSTSASSDSPVPVGGQRWGA